MKKKSRLNKFFGIGPMGASISLLFLSLFAWVNQMIGQQVTTVYDAQIKYFGIALIIFGLGLHIWSFWTLRNWWSNDKLCTNGPFKYFRHPMYAAWITFISSGIALYLNSWVYFIWVLLLHPIWHKLVKKEESTMIDTFGDIYNDYARQTGRFIPKVLIMKHLLY